MALLQELIQKIREKIKEKRMEAENREELPDDMTRDKYLRSLRRQRRVQMEEIEKEQLKRHIAEFNKARTRRYLWGIKGKIKEKQFMKANKKKVSVLANKINKLKRKDKQIWIGKSNL